MKKQKQILKYYRYNGNIIPARREIAFELQLASRLELDELCFSYNKEKLETAINEALETGNREAFMTLSEAYKQFIWE
ncbi:IDEAL domain-containing protein [Virgibacillus sp. YIM 98842]|uniref:IDEAL domain-containing protein n=1 Tax=Virgibacillus sp. YIM 98842 TaxID=2663533 RepID=UPI0013DD18D4|nr:IDEAL domain-containing protein [Virgibacillus sp. YIM 98842]